MTLAPAFFYLFAVVTVAAGFMVIAAKNPVHAVLFLILAFFNAAGLFVLLGAEFLAMVLVIVYVGAVAVLFLFVVMMLDINFAELRQGFLQYLPVGGLIGLVLFFELLLLVGSWVFGAGAGTFIASPVPPPSQVTNTHALGRILYTDYIYLFQASGMILLIAMVGAIVLTLRQREGVRRQSIPQQVARRRQESVELKKVPTRSGI